MKSDLSETLGAFAAIATFLVSWIYCAATYGFLFGFGLGWLPSLILAEIAWLAVATAWPVLLILFVIAVVGFFALVIH